MKATEIYNFVYHEKLLLDQKYFKYFDSLLEKTLMTFIHQY